MKKNEAKTVGGRLVDVWKQIVDIMLSIADLAIRTGRAELEIVRIKERIAAIDAREAAELVAGSELIIQLNLEDGGTCILNLSEFQTICSAGCGAYITLKGGTILRVKESPEQIIAIGSKKNENGGES